MFFFLATVQLIGCRREREKEKLSILPNNGTGKGGEEGKMRIKMIEKKELRDKITKC